MTEPKTSRIPSRTLNDVGVQSASFFKVRALIQELRPHVMECRFCASLISGIAKLLMKSEEVNSDAMFHFHVVHKIKLVMDECKHMNVEENKPGKFMLQFQNLPGETISGQESLGRHKGREQQQVLQSESLSEKSTKEGFGKWPRSTPLEGKHPEMPQPIGFVKSRMPLKAARRCIVGGSASGWNFFTYGGKKPVYYGVTKKSFRRKMKSCFA